MRSSTRTVISSVPLRPALATVGGGSSVLTWSACAPLRPSATPNSTRCPARSTVSAVASAVECTKTSPPSSRVRKPNPLSASYHLTLPVGTCGPFARKESMGNEGYDLAADIQAIGPESTRPRADGTGLAGKCRPGERHEAHGVLNTPSAQGCRPAAKSRARTYPVRPGRTQD